MGGRSSHTIEYRDNPELVKKISSLESSLSQMKINKEEFDKQLLTVKSQLESERLKFNSEMDKFRVVNKEQAEIIAKTQKELETMNIKNIEDVERVDSIRFSQLIDACMKVKPIEVDGINIGFFGCSGTGKSSLINTLSGKELCKTGRGQTTRVITPVASENFRYWDIPGQTDEISYVTADYIGLLKRLDFLGIVIWRTPHEMSKTMKLLEKLKIEYHLIVNKMDDVLDSEMVDFKNSIDSDLKETDSHPKRVFYTSNRIPSLYDFQELALCVGLQIKSVSLKRNSIESKLNNVLKDKCPK